MLLPVRRRGVVGRGNFERSGCMRWALRGVYYCLENRIEMGQMFLYDTYIHVISGVMPFSTLSFFMVRFVSL